MANKEMVTEWQDKIRRAWEYRDKHQKGVAGTGSYSSTCRDSRKYYRADWKKGVFPVNRIFSFGRSLIPSVYFKNPRVCVTATRPEHVFHARIVEAVDNQLIRQTGLKKTLKRAILNAYLNGIGPIKLGYDSEFGFAPELEVDQDTASASQYSRKEPRRIEYNQGVRPGMPWALPDYPENLIFPPGYQDPDAMPWIAQRVLRRLEDVKQDQKYRNVSKLEGTRILDTKSPGQLDLFHEEKSEMFAELFEIRDRSTGQVYVICEDQLLLAQDDALQMAGGLPFEFIVFNEDPEFPWGISDVSIIEPQQLELNEIRSQARRHRAIALLKFLYKRGAIKEAELENFFSSDVGVGVAVDDDVIAGAVLPMQPHVPADLAMEAASVEADMRLSLRRSENQMGSYRGGTPPPATETLQVAQTANLDTDERRDIVSDVMVNIVRKWNNYIFQFWTGEKVIEIVGPEGGSQWISFTGEQLNSEYDLAIDADTGFPASKALKLQAADAMLKQYNGDLMIDQVALRKIHLSNLEWLYPGVTGLVNEMPQTIAGAVSNLRQPSPSGGSSAHGMDPQRGGGRRGSTPDNAIPFEQAKKKFEGGGSQ